MNTNPNNGGFSYKGKENYLQVNIEDSRRIEGRYSPAQNCINKGSVFFFTPCRLTFKSRTSNYCYKTKEHSQTIKGAYVQVLGTKGTELQCHRRIT
jgi:hypothetical protein